ncbi:MAG: hypothetical protein ACRCVE_08355 [Plesiomonas sp.]
MIVSIENNVQRIENISDNIAERITVEHEELWDADLLKHQEGPCYLEHADEALMLVQKVLNNLEHADEGTLKLRFALLSLTLLQTLLSFLDARLRT